MNISHQSSQFRPHLPIVLTMYYYKFILRLTQIDRSLPRDSLVAASSILQVGHRRSDGRRSEGNRIESIESIESNRTT